MQRTGRIDPTLSEQPLICGARFGLHHRIGAPQPRIVDIGVGRDDVEVACQYYGFAALIEDLRVLDQAFEPRELVVELRTRLRVAVRQINGGNRESFDSRFQIARLLIGRVAR
jgi:hypothetical protein